MKYVIGSFLLFAALASGNPIFTTLINEFGFDDDALGWVELHLVDTLRQGVDMTGWLLTTSTSACTIAFTMPDSGFLVVDSASLAGGQYGRGTFRLNPAGDHIRVVPDSGHGRYADEVAFPVLPAGWKRAPMPPDHGSASMLNTSDGWTPIVNWYIDSTPTRGQDNDDYSTVSGFVTWGRGRSFYWVDIAVSGPMGSSYSNITTLGQIYRTPGLSAGRYEVAAWGWPPGESLFYPDSVDLGYSQNLWGIDLDFGAGGLEEGSQPMAGTPKVPASVVRRLPAGTAVFDASGRSVRDPKPGVYFVGEGPGVRGQGPGRMRKVLVTR